MHSSFFFVYVYSKSLYVLSTYVLIIRRINCINMTSGICHYAGDRLVCRFGFHPNLHATNGSIFKGRNFLTCVCLIDGRLSGGKS